MPIPEHGSAWCGPARPAGPALACVLALSLLAGGCAAWPRGGPAADTLAFLSQALEADARAREIMWKDFGALRDTPDAEVRAAVLQSLPGHSGYDLPAARQRLEALGASGATPADTARVARLRLAELGEVAECRAETAELRQRLARVVDIERRLNQGK